MCMGLPIADASVCKKFPNMSKMMKVKCGGNVTMRRSVIVASQDAIKAVPARPATRISKQTLVDKLLGAKEASGKSFSQIGKEIGCTNFYTAALFYNQQQLKPETAKALAQAVPDVQPMLEEMMKAPSRRFDPELLQDPTVYRFYEAIMHNGEALKAIINEECGDGIMSAIDMYASVDTVVGKQGEKRAVVTFNGKFLPYVEGKVADNVAQRS
ncbi:hypothetical protein CEUSTIGMA_g2941.t1 [Chlamydomonas eustigma]|uniref:Cyanate lyase C-terminal domain-containing protein n=1 Tax=Chlamydomonas eustigma TaxID=1157962 RepID=A0A250WXC9_9CHLO|nr:hypothetical protein CEUSTIGMA_g2941.t1 [Chlamydomonas eustigma]|eukprot:GAX75498.1 hypothetical protein CEUSTIGMA_g2941.t1 [Chlamydomonas eustigma]